MGERIVAGRTLLGLSVETLAQRTGLPLMRLAAYEAGLRRVLAPDLLRLCNVLKVGPAYFFDGLPGPENGAEDGEHDPEDDIGAVRTRSLA